MKLRIKIVFLTACIISPLQASLYEQEKLRQKALAEAYSSAAQALPVRSQIPVPSTQTQSKEEEDFLAALEQELASQGIPKEEKEPIETPQLKKTDRLPDRLDHEQLNAIRKEAKISDAGTTNNIKTIIIDFGSNDWVKYYQVDANTWIKGFEEAQKIVEQARKEEQRIKAELEKEKKARAAATPVPSAPTQPAQPSTPQRILRPSTSQKRAKERKSEKKEQQEKVIPKEQSRAQTLAQQAPKKLSAKEYNTFLDQNVKQGAIREHHRIKRADGQIVGGKITFTDGSIAQYYFSRDKKELLKKDEQISSISESPKEEEAAIRIDNTQKLIRAMYASNKLPVTTQQLFNEVDALQKQVADFENQYSDFTIKRVIKLDVLNTIKNQLTQLLARVNDAARSATYLLDRSQSFANFANTMSTNLVKDKYYPIKPEEVYEYLDLDPLLAKQLSAAMIREYIQQKIQPRIAAIKDQGSKEKHENLLRQIDRYIFLNDTLKENYDAYREGEKTFAALGDKSIHDRVEMLYKALQKSKLDLADKDDVIATAIRNLTQTQEAGYDVLSMSGVFPVGPASDLKQASDVKEGAETSYFDFLVNQIFVQQMHQRPHGYASEIKELMRTFYGIAQRKGEEFEEGTFVIEDPDGILFSFLLSFKDDGNRTYQRASTHYGEKVPAATLFGAIPWGAQGYGIDEDFSESMGHILFNAFQHKGKQYIFIKPEPWGTSYSQLIGHSWGLAKSLFRKAFLTGANDQSTMRKEHTPDEIKKRWSTLIDNSSLPDQEKTQLKKEGKLHGIYRMLEIIAEKEKAFAGEKNLKEFTDILENYGNPEIRKGREVIITQKELKDHPREIIVLGANAPIVKKMYADLATIEQEIKSSRLPKKQLEDKVEAIKDQFYSLAPTDKKGEIWRGPMVNQPLDQHGGIALNAAYQALEQSGLHNPRSIPTAALAAYTSKKFSEIQHDENIDQQTKNRWRELKFIFADDFRRESYDRYIDNRPQLRIDTKIIDDLLARVSNLQVSVAQYQGPK